ncbi:MAG: signal peptidase I [Firmicutes bacterium]|nr:signal peptidase I [Bacillota bacterium]
MHITKSDIITIIIICILMICTLFVIKPTIVRGESMTPTLQDGSYLILNKLAYCRHEPEYGDVIVVRSDYDGGELLIKRVIGVAGDEIRIDAHDVYRNGQRLDETYTNADLEEYEPEEQQTWVVPEDALFVLGDHRSVSADSRRRDVGFISCDDIVGKAVLRLFPFDEIGRLE